MAIHIANISATEEAGRTLRHRYDAFRPRPGDTFALLYVSEYFYSDGSTVEGFRPGYKAGPITTKGGFDDHWALARLPDGLEFYFMPQFVWDPMGWYLIDKHVGFALYSIEPAAGSPCSVPACCEIAWVPEVSARLAPVLARG